VPFGYSGDMQHEQAQSASRQTKKAKAAKIITSLNLKGGVGKTHLCWLIAGVCQERNKRCLVLDLDKQGNIPPSSHAATIARNFFDELETRTQKLH